MARIVVVSNRVAVPSGDGGARAGGLEVAIRSYLKRHHGLWFGWSGRVASKAEVKTREVESGGVTYITTDLTRADYQEYYNGFANRMLWPILHYRLDLAEYSSVDLTGYMRVNDHFAECLHNVLKPDDIVWVHDYHLLPLAKALRDRGHRNRIGFFLHVPFPPPELITALTKHERLILSLCHYDLVGFQTDNDTENFARYLKDECRMPSRDRRTFIAGNRAVRLGAFPVGVETAEFERLARRTVRSSFVREVVDSLAGRAMIIGVDRLDYSKGIALRVKAFERFLADYPPWRGAVTYLQITPRSRSEIKEYSDMERHISETVGQVNGRYGEPSWTPIRYVNRPYSRSALAGLYRASRAALVTPLRDGMNLVAKEYTAAQDPEDPGVLILSRFAGAANECTTALLVNPYDAEAAANAIGQALSMPIEERRGRHAEMIKVLTENDIKF
ncbi:MAG TPA: trehalose-6-phosphate synthase, partial [Bradyrhizobium sp.]|nr:trehalose-6-phosphate synthase [Bradyrhizobium sp.]